MTSQLYFLVLKLLLFQRVLSTSIFNHVQQGYDIEQNTKTNISFIYQNQNDSQSVNTLRFLDSVYQCQEDANCIYGQCKNKVCQCFEGYQGPKCNNLATRTSDSDPKTLIAGIIVGLFILFTIAGCIWFRSIETKNKLSKMNNLEESEISTNPRKAHKVTVSRKTLHSFLPWKQKISQVGQGFPDEQESAKLYNCSICLDDIPIKREFSIHCPSKHIFHKKCVKLWLLKHNTCPQCRAEIIS